MYLLNENKYLCDYAGQALVNFIYCVSLLNVDSTLRIY